MITKIKEKKLCQLLIAKIERGDKIITLLIDWDLLKPVSEISETPRCATRTVHANFNILCCDFN